MSQGSSQMFYWIRPWHLHYRLSSDFWHQRKIVTAPSKTLWSSLKQRWCRGCCDIDGADQGRFVLDGKEMNDVVDRNWAVSRLEPASCIDRSPLALGRSWCVESGGDRATSQVAMANVLANSCLCTLFGLHYLHSLGIVFVSTWWVRFQNSLLFCLCFALYQLLR